MKRYLLEGAGEQSGEPVYVMRENLMGEWIRHDDADLAALVEALEEIARLPDAYAADIFPEPDLRLAHEALVGVGLTLDAISARAGREFTGIAARIAQRALAAVAGTTRGRETP